MKILKKTTLIGVLFSTVLGLNGALSQMTERLTNICIKNPLLTYAASSIVGGAVGGIASQSLYTLKQQGKEKTATQFFLELTLYLSLVSIVGFGSQNLCNAISEETVLIVPCITIPLYFTSLFCTFAALEWKNI